MQLNIDHSHANIQEKSASDIVYLIMVPTGALGPCIASLNAVRGSNHWENGTTAKHIMFPSTDLSYFGWGVWVNFHVIL